MHVSEHIPQNEDLIDFKEISSEIENFKNLVLPNDTLWEEKPTKTQLEEIKEDEWYVKIKAVFSFHSAMSTDENTRTNRTTEIKTQFCFKTKEESLLKKEIKMHVIKSPQTVSTYSDTCSNSSKSRSTSPIHSPKITKTIPEVQEKTRRSINKNSDLNMGSLSYRLHENAGAFVPQAGNGLLYTEESKIPIKNATKSIITNNHFNLNSTPYTPNKNKFSFYNNKFDNESSQINWDKVWSGEDQRTTIMIRNIPNKYSKNVWAEELDEEFCNKYDIWYLPIDYTNNCNLGFAFINFINPLHIITFSNCFKGKKWKKYLSEKRCELVYGKIQGKNNWKLHCIKGSSVCLNKIASNCKTPLIKTISAPFDQVKLPISFLSKFLQFYPDHTYTITEDKRYFIFDNYLNY